MSGIGFWELIILFLIGLVVLGPERLPRVANQIGSWLGQARRMTRVMKRQLEEELNLEKRFDIEPPPAVKPKNDDDDAYSPAHGADSAGTGVGDEGSQEDVEETAEDIDEPGEPAKDDVAKEAT